MDQGLIRSSVQCLQCPYISTSVHLICRHLRAAHTRNNPSVHLDLDILYKPVTVLSWTQSTSAKSFWTIVSDSLKSMDGGAANRPMSDQLCTANMISLDNLRKRESHGESHVHTVQKQQNSSQHSGQDTYEGTRPWLNRTQWIVIFSSD